MAVTVLHRRLKQYGFYVPHVRKVRRAEVVAGWAPKVKLGDLIYVSDYVVEFDAKKEMRKHDIEIEFIESESDSVGGTMTHRHAVVNVYRVVKVGNETIVAKKHKDIIFDINDIVT